jgi:hypothetical protein
MSSFCRKRGKAGLDAKLPNSPLTFYKHFSFWRKSLTFPAKLVFYNKSGSQLVDFLTS